MADVYRLARIDIDASGGQKSAEQLAAALTKMERAVDPLGAKIGTLESKINELSGALGREAETDARILNLLPKMAAERDRLSQALTKQSAAEQQAIRDQEEYAAGVAKVEAVLQRRQRAEEAEIENLFRLAAANKAVIEAERQRQQAETSQISINRQLGVSTPTAGPARASAAVFEDAFREQEQLTAAAQRYKDALNPLLPLQRAYRDELELINKTAKSGNLTEAERAAALQQTKNSFAEQVRALKESNDTTQKAGGISRQAASELRNLSFQLNDVVTGFASGQKPMMIFAQQGGQIVQNTQGLGVVFRALISPIGLAVAGVAALAGVFALGIGRAESLNQSLKQIGVTLRSTGNASGLAAGDVQSQVIALARQPGVNRGTAQQAAQGLLSDPLISGDIFKQALPLARDFAQVTGQDIPSAAKALATALTGGYQAALQLDRQFQILSGAELEQIRNLEEQGRKSDAARIILAALQRQIKGVADDALTPLAKATNNLGDAWDRMLDALAKTSTIQTAKRALTSFLNDIAALAGGPLSPGQAAKEIGLLNQQIDAISKNMKTLADARGAQPFARETTNALQSMLKLGDQTIAAGGGGPLSLDENNTRLMEQLTQATDKAAASTANLGTQSNTTKGDLHVTAESVRALSESLDPAARQLEQVENWQKLVTKAFFAGLIPLNEWIAKLGTLDNMKLSVPTPEKMVADAEAEAREAGMSPTARARASALRTLPGQNPNLSPDQVTAIANARARAAAAGGGVNLGEQISSLNDQAKASQAVAAAYAVSDEAGRKAEVELKALTSQHKLGAAAVKQYADALLREDAARRLIEGSKLLRQMQDEADDQTKLNAALAVSTVEYDKQRIAIEAARLVAQGKLTTEQAATYKTIELQKLQNQYTEQAIELNRQLDPTAAYTDQIAKLNELVKTGKLSATATQAAYEDAYIKMGKAGSSWLDGASAGLLDFARQARNVGQQVADALGQAFSSLTDGLARAMLGMSVNLKSILNDLKLSLAKAFIGSTVTGPLASMFGGLLGGVAPGLGGAGSVGGAGSIGGITVNGQTFVPQGGAGGGMGSILGGGGGGMGFGGSNLFGGLGTFMSRPLTGGPNPLFGSAGAGGLFSGDELPTVPWDEAGSGMFAGGTTVGGVFSGLMNIGSGAMTAFGGGANTMGQIGGGMQMIGGVMSMIPGPVGMIGMGLTVIGSVLGMLGKKKVTAPQAVSNLSFGADGWSTETAMSRGKGSLQVGTGKAGGAVGDVIDQLTGLYGLGLGAGTPGGFLINSIGKKTGNLWQVGLGSYSNPMALPEGFKNGGSNVTAQYSSAEDAAQALAAMIIRQGALNGSLTGLTDTQKTVLKAEDVTTIDQIKAALDFSTVYDDIKRGSENVTDAEKSIRDLNTQFRSLSQQAESYGLDVGIIAQRQQEAINKLATDMNTDVRRRQLSMTPEGQLQLALEDADKARDAAIKNAEYINSQVTGTLVDINALEAQFGRERVQIIEQANQAANDSLEQLWRRLTYGDLSAASPLGTLEGTKSAYEQALAAAQGGDLTARNNLAGLAQDYVTAGYQYQGSNAAQADLVSGVAAAIAPFFTSNDNINTAADTFNSAVSSYARIQIEQAATIDRLIATIANQNAVIAELTQRLDRLAA